MHASLAPSSNASATSRLDHRGHPFENNIAALSRARRAPDVCVLKACSVQLLFVFATAAPSKTAFMSSESAERPVLDGS
jgi:hypothetical protein